MAHLTRSEARAILRQCVRNPAADFFTLSTDEVDGVLREADARRYRKPANANGSRARYFFAYLQRAAAREES
jgi:hypothetical protein